MPIAVARATDGARIRRLLADVGLPHEDISPAHLAHFLVARGGEELTGVVGLEVHGPAALLRSLAVPPAHRGRGIAIRLTDEAEAYARSLGVRTLYLLTTTAEGFFAKRGYLRTDRRDVPAAVQGTAEFRSICPASAVCMRKDLTGTPATNDTRDAR